MRALTGEQFELTRVTPAGPARAIVTEVAAGIRSYEVSGVHLTEPFGPERMPPSACGIVLAPWPNRVADARWEWDGTIHQLDITEPAANNAIHGLLRHTAYRCVERGADSVTLAATVHPRRGYPFLLDTSVEHRLVDEGLTVTHTVTNAGAEPAPFAVGAHPYLRIGEVASEELRLTLSAHTHLVSDERGNLTGEHPVAGTPYAIRDARVGDLSLDDGFADLDLRDGRSVQTLHAPDGRSVELWADASFAFLQVFTSRSFATMEAGRLAIALEPMTAPANALNTGRGVRVLQPGESWSGCWGIRHHGV